MEELERYQGFFGAKLAPLFMWLVVDLLLLIFPVALMPSQP